MAVSSRRADIIERKVEGLRYKHYDGPMNGPASGLCDNQSVVTQLDNTLVNA
jgi:hypothetical protein